ncbi:MAG: hypothetical protein K2X91_15655, partial [Thermoleophilia bacterium]|nr:hypothetical protein [Thermoleophilia bacterium]
MFGLLLLSLLGFCAGVLWADLGGRPFCVRPPTWPGLAAAGLSLAAFWAAALLGLRSDAASRLLAAARAVGRAALIALAFAAGWDGFEDILARARHGAVWAARASPGPGPVRFVDARVAARRSTGFGEEVELWDVRARAGEEPVPERLVLAWADR